MSKNQHVGPLQLEADIREDVIDTVIVAFSDHQGQLIGKRTDGEFYLDVVAEEGTENCDYLIACDIDNVPIPGFRWASYDQGYGDMRGVVDHVDDPLPPVARPHGGGARRPRRRRHRARRSRCRRVESCRTRPTRRRRSATCR